MKFINNGEVYYNTLILTAIYVDVPVFFHALYVYDAIKGKITQENNLGMLSDKAVYPKLSHCSVTLNPSRGGLEQLVTNFSS